MRVEKVTDFNAGRIIWCCQQNNVDETQLADELDISEATINKALHLGGALTINQLQKIADYFHRDLLFFFEDAPVNDETAYSAQFRTIRNHKPTLSRKINVLVRRAEEQRQVFVDLFEDTEEYGLTKWDTNRIARQQGESIKDFALRARNWLELSERNKFDTYRLALEKAGILVFVSNGYQGRWKIDPASSVTGFSLYYETCPLIATKKQRNPVIQSFTVMHELGHLLLHRTSSIDEEHDMRTYRGHEKEANEFAGALLVPDNFLARIDMANFPRAVTDFDEYLSAHRNAWGVSGDVIIRRLRDEQLIKQSDYEAYVTFKNSLTYNDNSDGGQRYRATEPLHMFGRLFVTTVFEALHTEQITINKASKFLDNLKLDDLRRLEKKLVYP